MWVLIGAATIIIVALAVVLPVYFVVIKPKNDKNSGTAGAGEVGGGSGNDQSPTGATSGGDGSEIITEDGEKFVYKNSFGGFCKYSVRLTDFLSIL